MLKGTKNDLLRQEMYNFLGVPEGLIGRFFVVATAFLSAGLIWFFSAHAIEERFAMMENAAQKIECVQEIVCVIGWLFGCIVGIVLWNVWLSKRITWKI